MVLSELGASAGLNLNWDRYAPDIGANFWHPNSPYAQLALESDSSGAESGAALTLRLWPDNQTIPLGRVDFHAAGSIGKRRSLARISAITRLNRPLQSGCP